MGLFWTWYEKVCPSFLWNTNSYFICGQASMLNLDMEIKVSFKSQNVKKWILLLRPFLLWLKTKCFNLNCTHIRWDPYGHYCVWKSWGNKSYQSTSNSQSWDSWLVKQINVWWSGLGSNISFKTGMTVVCLSLSAWQDLEYHYIKGKKLFHITTDF